jgi:hypothetical protein
MPLGRGIVELFEAIPERIEVSGQAPTWRVTGGSFESVLRYAREAYGDAAVIAREDRTRWWPRVTLTVTTDPALVAAAPDPEVFATPSQPAATDDDAGEPTPPRHVAEAPVEDARPEDGGQGGPFTGVLEEIFAHQEAQRRRRLSIPQQRSSDA